MFRDEGIAHVPDLSPAYAVGRMTVVWRAATAARLEHNPPKRLLELLIARQPS